MNHLAQLEKFNPVNIIHHGSQKVEHPATGYSNTISQNVESMHQDFGSFHKNLKNLVMLYKTRHQLMESMNENGLYTAKCYREMLEGTPLAGIVASAGKHKDKAQSSGAIVPVDPENEANKTGQLQTYLEKRAPSNESDDIEPSEYPDSGVIREKLDPDEGSMIGKDLSRDHAVEPEGLKASKTMSIQASNASHMATIKDVVGDDDRKHADPPSAASVVAAKYDRRESEDPPSTKFPDDETSVPSTHVEKNKDHGTNSGSVNVIVDDNEDSFTNERDALETASPIVEGEKEGKEAAAEDDEKQSLGEKVAEDANGVVGQLKDLVFGKDEKVDDATSKEDDREERAPSPVQSNDGGDIVAEVMADIEDDAGSRGSNSDLEPGRKDDAEYLNISNDGALMVMKNEPEPPQSTSQFHSYYDVHKAAYKEMNAKLVEHTKLVKYVEKWENTVFTRVQARYTEYAKIRKGLNHYAKKVGALLDEEERLKEKNRPMKPKQLEKLERNQIKLRGTRETHDRKGEELIMLMEEVTLRAWRDAFPLLQKTIGSEVDFAAIEQKHISNLSGCSELLQTMEDKESIPIDGRLRELKNSSPDELYTGSRMKHSSGKVDV